MDTSRWKLYRVIYDYDGWRDIEGQTNDEENFQRRLAEVKDEKEISRLIGTAIKLENGDTIINEELEGPKENLELVLKLVNESNKQNEAKGEQ